MSKRNKKFRSNRSAFKLEALEQRQLLATIVGGTGGTEVNSNVTVAGKVYDQILMTGSSVTVQADAGQITRVDFMDADGDIVRAEFSGAGSLNISLSGFVAAAAPKLYTTTTQYVTGLASFTVTNSDATTNFLTTSLGPLGPAAAFQGLLNPIFANGATQGGNNTANVSRLVIVGDSTNLIGGAGTAFGSINAANAIFGDTTGVTGIFAPNTSFKSGSTITIGDILPGSTVATPILQLGLFSDVKTVTIAGGKLASAASGVPYNFLNVTSLVSVTGINSKGTSLDTQTLSNVGTATPTYSSGLGTVTIDGSTATTASLDALYKAKYLQDVIINNGLAAGVVFHSLQFGNVTVNGNLQGVITTDANDNNVSDSSEQAIGNVTINGNILDGGYIEASTSIGTVTVTGGITHTVGSATITVNGTPGVPNQIAVISTLGRASTSAAIGAVTVTGDIVLGTSTTPVPEGLISANRALTTANAVTSLGTTAGIGNISGANLAAWSSLPVASMLNSVGTTLTAATHGGIINDSGPSGASIGTVTFTGDVLVSSTTIGFVDSSRNIGAISAKSLTIVAPATYTATAGTTTATLTGQGISTNNNGTIGTITTSGTAGITLVGGVIWANGSGSIGAVTVGGTGNLYMGTTTAGVSNAVSAGIVGGSIGTTTVVSGNMTTGTKGAILATAGNIGDVTLTAGKMTIQSEVIATGGNVGNILLTDTSSGVSTITSNVQARIANSVGGAVGNITVTKGDLTLGAAGVINAATTVGNITTVAGNLSLGAGSSQILAAISVGNISVTGGNLTFGAAGATIKVGTGAAAGNIIGNVTVSGGGIVGAAGNVEFQANQIGNVSVTGAAGTANLLSNVIFAAKGTTQGTVGSAKIGNVTLNSSANATGNVAAGAVSTTAITGTGFSSSGSIGNVTVTTATAGTIVAGGSSLIIRAGSSNMGTASAVADAATAAAAVAAGNAVNITMSATTNDNVEAVSIGDVSIVANISGGGLSTAVTAGSGLIIASGINNTVAGGFRDWAGIAAGNPVVTPGAATSGSIGNLTISDLSGGVVKTPFSNANLATVGFTDTNGSIIIADKINSITVNSGPGAILSLPSLSGLPLRGALGSATGVSAIQEVVGNANAAGFQNLVIVVV